jgi:riboflavin synthase
MFTGIIQKLGKVVSLKKGEKELILGIKIPHEWPAIKLGDSIAVNGVCLTVAEKKQNTMLFFCQFETLSVTNLGDFKTGDWVNLERAMKASDRLGGHMVQGHVDFTTLCLEKRVIGEGWQYSLQLPRNRVAGLVLKGSIALDGISLTVSHLQTRSFCVDIIPFTHENTNIRFWKKGTRVNVETDILGKYIENYMKALKK